MDFKKYSAAMLVVVLLSLALLAPVSAANAENTAPADKIDSALQEKLDSMSDLDTIDVSVWLCDIDYEEVEQEVTQRLERKAEKGEISGQALLLPEDDLQTMKQQNSGNAQLAAANLQPVNGLNIAAISQEDAQGFIETKREVTSREYARQNAQVFESLFPKEKQDWFRNVPQRQPEVIYSCKYAPNIMMTLTKGQIEEIARSADVEEIFYYNTQVSAEALEMEEAMAAPQTAAAASNISLAYQTTTGVSNMRIYNHADGTGIKIGQLENSVPDFTKPAFDHMRDNANPENNKFKVVFDGSYTRNWDHSTCVAALMVGKSDDFSAIVPNASLYFAANYDGKTGTYKYWKQSMELLVDEGVNVINASTALPGSEKGAYDDSAKWLDHLIYSHNVSVCISAGNYYRIMEGCMSYNAILIGNIYDKHTIDLSDDVRFVNTPGEKESAYSDSNTAAYKPDIMAPGATAGSCYSPMTNSYGGGTSFSAPIVTGAVAQLCGMYSYFKTKPALLKAALLAGAIKTQEMEAYDSDADLTNNVDSMIGSWRPGLCHKNGAGMVNVINAAAVLYDSCYLYFPNFGGTNNPLTQEIEVEAGSRLQICLSWLKKNTVTTGSHETGAVEDAGKDTFILELLGSDGELLYNSWYRYDTKEYIAFEPEIPGTYTIRVRKTNLLSTGTDIALCWYQR